MSEDTSLIHKLRLLAGWTYIPAQTILPVIQDGEVHHFLGQGYYRLSRFRRSYGELISTAFRFAPLSGTVRTAEGLATTIDIGLLYAFQPRQTDLRSLSHIMRQKTYAQNAWLNNILEAHVRKVLQQVCGQYLEADLVDGRNITHIERQIRLTLRAKLPPFLSLSPHETAVSVLGMAPPAQIEAEREAARCRDIYAGQLHHQRADIAGYVHEQELAQNSTHFNFSLLKASENVAPARQTAPVNNLVPHANGHSPGSLKEVHG